MLSPGKTGSHLPPSRCENEREPVAIELSRQYTEGIVPMRQRLYRACGRGVSRQDRCPAVEYLYPASDIAGQFFRVPATREGQPARAYRPLKSARPALSWFPALLSSGQASSYREDVRVRPRTATCRSQLGTIERSDSPMRRSYRCS